MEFGWTDEQRAFYRSVRDFARERLTDDELVERDTAGKFSREAWRRCGELGLPGLPIAEEHGGGGADPVTIALALEALGEGCEDGGLLFSLNAHMWSCAEPVQRFGSEAQRRRYLPGLCDGSTIGVQAVTEPEAGSDAMNLRTRADRDGASYVLTGTKCFITNAPEADLFVVFARTGRQEHGFAGVTAFLVERSTPGLEVGAATPKMGLRTSPMGELVLDGCRVPAGSVLGGEGGGYFVFGSSMEAERTLIMASALGTMARQVDRCVAYARQRRQFGRPIADFQAVSHRIADMRVRLEAARLLVYEAAWHLGRARAGEGGAAPDSAALHSSIAKLFVSESYLQSSLDALQVHGASAYVTGLEFERDVRDAVGSRLYSGTSDMQRNVIGRSLGL